MTCLQDKTEAMSKSRPSVECSRDNPHRPRPQEAAAIWEECGLGIRRSLSFPRKYGNLDFF